MPYFQTLGVPCAVGILAGVAVALTLGPAIITIGSRFGLFEPKRAMRIRFWRRIGTTIVRWPGPILIAIVGAGADRPRRPARIQGELRRHEITSPTNIPANDGLRGGEPAFLHGPDESGGPADRGRSRPPQLVGLPRPRQDRQGGVPGARNRAGSRRSPGPTARPSSTRRFRSS